jgi:uridine kinase
MFQKAAETFNIDLSDSVMIGDSERDILAGKNAGCITVGVRTGYGIKKTTVMPDYFFENLKEAVDFILDEPYGNIFRTLTEKYKSRKKDPFIISVAGNARSGKSILSAYLLQKFKEQHVRSLKVELDHWILPENKRADCRNVYDRFRLENMVADIGRMLSGETILVNTYANHPERQSYPVQYSARDFNVIILDGIVALSHEFLRNISDFRIFMEIPEEIFASRFLQYYRWRGKSAEEAGALMEKRKSDEYQLIEKESKFADLVTNQFTA